MQTGIWTGNLIITRTRRNSRGENQVAIVGEEVVKIVVVEEKETKGTLRGVVYEIGKNKTIQTSEIDFPK